MDVFRGLGPRGATTRNPCGYLKGGGRGGRKSKYIQPMCGKVWGVRWVYRNPS